MSSVGTGAAILATGPRGSVAGTGPRGLRSGGDSITQPRRSVFSLCRSGTCLMEVQRIPSTDNFSESLDCAPCADEMLPDPSLTAAVEDAIHTELGSEWTNDPMFEDVLSR